eukprot:gene2953-3686_t
MHIMKNKGLIIFLTTVTSLLCFYYLSFSVLDVHVQRRATQYATHENGHLDLQKKQAYLDSVWNEPVFQCFGLHYTYEEVKENAISWGLDLQGGMHVTLEVSPIELVKGLAGSSHNEHLLAALQLTEQKQRIKPTTPFIKLFYQAYKEVAPAGKLSDLFAHAANRNRITRQASDQEVLQYLEGEISHSIDRAFEIIRSRIDRFGTTQPNIQQLPGTGKIQIELPGVNNPERVRKLLQGVAQLRFWKVYDAGQLGKTLAAVNSLLVTETKEQQKKATTKKAATTSSAAQELATQLDQKDHQHDHDAASALSPIYSLAKPGYGLAYTVEHAKTIQQILERPDVKLLFPKDLVWLWDVKPHRLPNGEEIVAVHPIQTSKNNRPLLEGDVITDARQVFDDRGTPAVTMQMNGHGAKLWKNITASNIGNAIAITLDDKVYSAPMVNTEIPNGNSQITGHFSIEEAKDLANILKAGSLPAPVKITEEAIIGPTLSKTAQAQGITSMALGLSVIILFMLVYYAKGGFVANLALLFNVLFILGILAQFNAALTLPGIAGIVLTIGMAIDANVLIFERIREELRLGISIKEALNKGYHKAYSSIIDANVTTFLTGAILYILGQGPVRGFATTLIIGIATSFFTSIFITRLIFTWWINKNSQDKTLTFSFSYNRNLLTNCRINFLGKKNLFYAASGLFIAIGMLLIVQQGGLNLGVDFTGGRSYVVSFSEPVETALLKTKLAEHLGDQGTEVKSYGANHVVKITTNYMVQETSSEAEEQAQHMLIKSIQNATKFQYAGPSNEPSKMPSFHVVNSAKVGPSIAGDIQASAQKSIVFSLLAIFGYIVVRFRRWQFGLASLIGLAHDTLMVFATFAIARAFGYAYEIDQVFVASILTIIGYSINDTVIIFDRIREMRLKNPNDPLDVVVNQSVNETLSRTLITSLTTLATVLILFVWGGTILRGFSFALFVGIAFGTYSSICIAAPLVVDFSKKKRFTKK